MSAQRILFICKNRSVPYTGDTSSRIAQTPGNMSSGLYNSVNFVVNMLKGLGVEAKLVDVVDNNCIDREVSLFKPTHVVIEALWVVPSKFEVLTKLHPNVKWIVRLHSDLPFIACEGIAMEWIFLTDKNPNVSIAANSYRMDDDLTGLLTKPIVYLPNYYPTKKHSIFDLRIHKCSDTIDIGCFGAIRQLKNQLIQAVGAIHFANRIGKKLKFHINGNRIEGNADPVIKNIRKLFEANTQGHELVEHNWMPHAEFLKVVGGMDILMQVSFSETYNIVTADAIMQGVPVVTSSEIKFVSKIFYANTTSAKNIASALYRTHLLAKFNLHHINQVLLSQNSDDAIDAWKAAFNI